ncbi:hypothetical protein ACYDMD_19920 [Pantoea agglomerans]
MNKKILALLLISAAGTVQAAAPILSDYEIREKAGFALGFTADQVQVTDVRATDDITVKFNANVRGRVFQCYYQGAGKNTSDALCSATDGKPMPASAACNELLKASGHC